MRFFAVFRFKTKTWSVFAKGPIVDFDTRDEKYLYCVTTGPATPAVVRVRLSDGHGDPVVDLSGLRRITNGNGKEFGLTPDNQFLFTRDTGTQEIYALNVRWP